jgi:hypothetical protein
MDNHLLETMFGRMGARVKIHGNINHRDRGGIDIRYDMHGEYFDIAVAPNDKVEYEVVDIRPGVRHLLLMTRRDDRKQKFLCGHDERHWFACAVPGDSVTNVVKAMEALQPTEVRWNVSRRVKRAKNRLRRRNKAFVRQGEWFFIPAPELVVNPKLVLRNEPISRGAGSKPHMCQFLYRTGGEPVWVCGIRPQGLKETEYSALIRTNPEARYWGWYQRLRDASAFVRGRVSHPDHKTIVLDGWHRVLMNTENLAPGASAIVFLD